MSARIERAVEGREDPEAEAVRGYCAAVRSAITDDGRPPLAASGLQLRIGSRRCAASLDRAATKGAEPCPLQRLRQLLARGLEHTRSMWPPIRRAYAWVYQAARILENAAGEPAKTVRRRPQWAARRHGAPPHQGRPTRCRGQASTR